jgi:hypothetical protein
MKMEIKEEDFVSRMINSLPRSARDSVKMHYRSIYPHGAKENKEAFLQGLLYYNSNELRSQHLERYLERRGYKY